MARLGIEAAGENVRDWFVLTNTFRNFFGFSCARTENIVLFEILYIFFNFRFAQFLVFSYFT